jgi:hypothetical protein
VKDPAPATLLVAAPGTDDEYMSSQRRLFHPMTDCTCVVTGGVKPKPPAAVAARGLTPPTPTKPGSGSDVSRGVVSVFAAGAVSRISGDWPPSAECGRVVL